MSFLFHTSGSVGGRVGNHPGLPGPRSPKQIGRFAPWISAIVARRVVV